MTRDFTTVAVSDPVLSDFLSPLEPLVILSDRCDATYHIRDAITRSLIRGHQAGESAVFGEILMVAGLPMLTALRRRFDCRTFSADDLDQLLLTAFTEAISGFDLSRHELQTWVVLKSRTGKRILQQLTKEQNRARRTVDFDQDELDRLDSDQPYRRSSDLVLDADDELELAELLAQEYGDVLDEEELGLVVESKIRRIQLSTRVLGKSKSKLALSRYQRLLRRQGRAIEKLRDLMCPIRRGRGL